MRLRSSLAAGWLGLALGALACGAVALLLMFFAVVTQELQAYLEEPVDNVHWNLTQLELDLVRFNAAVEIALIAPAGPSDRDLQDLRQRYDLFYSRSHTLTAGSMFSVLGLAPIVAPMAARVSGFLQATTPLIDGDAARLRAALPEIARTGEDLRAALRVMEVDVIDLYARYADDRRAGLTHLLTQMAWASGGMIALLLVLLAFLLQMNRQAERRSDELQRLSSRLQATVATALDAVIVADRGGRILDFNSAAERIFGYARAEAVGQDLGALIVPAHLRAAHQAGMARVARNGRSAIVNAGRLQMQAMRKGGEEFTTELSIASNEGPDGTIYIAFLRDISQRIADEAALRAARDEALAAEKAKTNFLAVMSHEMRTPLNGVMAALELIAQDTPASPTRRFVDIARSSAEILLRHVTDVLDISKVDAEKMALAEDDFDLVQMVTALVEMVRPTAEARSNRLELVALSEFPHLRGDAFRLGQVVQNLLSNANKFTEGGTITVELEQAARADDQLIVELRVTDTGIGIAKPDQDRVFQDFVMLDPSFGRAVGGTGLGLAISRRLIAAMAGEIGVESEPDQGSCFWLRVPLRVAGPAPVPSPALAGPAEPPAAAALDLLVVEDNATNRILLEAMLTRLGHRVTLAEDGAEGVRQARGHRFDAILMDVSMPVMDGLTAAGLIRAEGQSTASRIIAVTAHGLPEDALRFQASGMADLLTKPVSRGDLLRVLDRIRPSGSGLAALNPDRQAELLAALGPEGLHRTLARFALDMRGVLARLEHILAGDAPLPEAAAAFHEGHGSAAMVGADALAAAFRHGELGANRQDRVGAQQALRDSQRVWDAVEQRLAQADLANPPG